MEWEGVGLGWSGVEKKEEKKTIRPVRTYLVVEVVHERRNVPPRGGTQHRGGRHAARGQQRRSGGRGCRRGGSVVAVRSAGRGSSERGDSSARALALDVAVVVCVESACVAGVGLAVPARARPRRLPAAEESEHRVGE